MPTEHAESGNLQELLSQIGGGLDFSSKRQVTLTARTTEQKGTPKY